MGLITAWIIGLKWNERSKFLSPSQNFESTHLNASKALSRKLVGLGIDALSPEHQGWKTIEADTFAGENKTLGGLRSSYSREVWLVYHETRRHDAALSYACDWITQVFQKSQFKKDNTGSHESECSI